jgi:Na+/H+ antiporter NhaC
MSSGSNDRLEFHGGTAGALTPFALFLSGVAWLGLSGAPNERGFWPILVAALLLSMLLTKDRHAWSEKVIEGMSKPLVMIMIMAWLLAGVLGSLIRASGFVEALVWIAEAVGVEGAAYAVAAFLICCLVSTSTGTSLGTVILCAPLLYPTGGSLGTDPVILMGAILGGATFGDNVSPVSDTTIASAMTQGADMRGVVRSRMRYALPAAAVAMVVYAVFGSAEAAVFGSAEASVVPGQLDLPSASPRGLPMLGAPALVIFLLFQRRHLLHGLLAGIGAATGIGLAFGLLVPSDLMRIDEAAFVARGLIVDGIENGIGVSVFTLLLMGLVATIEAAGVVDRLVEGARSRAHSRAAAERWIVATMSGAAFLTTHSTVAIITAGGFARQLGERFGISGYRRANLLDITACSWPHIFPWFIPAILTASTTTAGEAYGMPRLSAVQVGLANAHSWALLCIVLLAVVFGYGRDHEIETSVGET